MTSFSTSRVIEALGKAGLLVSTSGTLPEHVTDIVDDSRAVTPGALFVAVRGSAQDGHQFLSHADERGAFAAIIEEPGGTTLPAIMVREGRRAAAIAAAAAFDNPARSIRLVGVTGTNGKTTTVDILRHLLDSMPDRAASIGTLGVLVGTEGAPSTDGAGLTTPGPVELQRVLRQLVGRGVRTVAMEVSSHSLDQQRVEGLTFDAAVFTNFTRDHLDYHKTIEGYFGAKARLVRLLASDGAAVVNADDPAWTSLPSARRIVTFGLGDVAEVRADSIRYHTDASEWRLIVGTQRHQLRLPLIGDFNVANALAAAAAAWSLGMPLGQIASKLRTVPQVPGRLEVIHRNPTILRDYAHTPDALERALAALRPFARKRLIVVFGCGGDRDRGKRPLMGSIAERRADAVILTSDNPRGEDPDGILDDIERGMRGERHQRIEDRRDAIARAIAICGPDDVVLLAGKGHETYQIRGTARLPFDENQIVDELTRKEPGTRGDAGAGDAW